MKKQKSVPDAAINCKLVHVAVDVLKVCIFWFRLLAIRLVGCVVQRVCYQAVLTGIRGPGFVAPGYKDSLLPLRQASRAGTALSSVDVGADYSC